MKLGSWIPFWSELVEHPNNWWWGADYKTQHSPGAWPFPFLFWVQCPLHFKVFQFFFIFSLSPEVVVALWYICEARSLNAWTNCHGTTSLPLLHPPLAASNPIHLHSTSSTSTLLQLWCALVQLVQLHHAHSWTNCRSILDPFGPGSHTKGCHLQWLKKPFQCLADLTC